MKKNFRVFRDADRMKNDKAFLMMLKDTESVQSSGTRKGMVRTMVYGTYFDTSCCPVG